MNLFNKFLSTSNYDKFLFLLAIGISLLIKIVVIAVPLRWYSKLLGSPGLNFAEEKVNNQKTLLRVSRAVNRCSRYAPWETKCLVDAVTAKLLLRWHGIPSTLFLGVNKDEDKKLVAHAWLKCGETFITGKPGHQKFTVVSSFA